jgi:uncharacterized BrkB/YihY/UPF0761 family membrane protein
LIELRDALNTIWEVPTPALSGLRMLSNFIKERLFSFALVLAVGFILVVSLAVSAWVAALGIYLGKASFASTYGAASSVVVLIVWVYYSAQIYFLGAEFTKTFANCYGSQRSRLPAAVVTDNATITQSDRLSR